MRGLAFYGHDFFYIAEDRDLVAESIIRIIMTNSGERPGRPFFGVNLKAELFEQADQTSFDQVKTNIIQNLALYEPRAQIEALEITGAQDNTLVIKVAFILVGDSNLDDPRIITIRYKLAA